MKNNKRYIILIIILIIFFITIYLLIGKKEIEKRKNETIILLNTNTVFKYSNDTWSYVNKNNINKYNWKKFNVFLNGEYEGKYYVWNDDKWYLFNDLKEAFTYTEKFLGLDANFDVKVKNFEVENNTNNNYVSNVLKENDISLLEELTVNNVIKTDIDNDGKIEEIYIISNTFPIDYNPKLIFSYVFMIKNEKMFYLYKYKEEGDIYSGCMPYINSIIDADNDKTYEVLLTCARYSMQEPINSLYKFENNKFKMLISNE